MVIDYLLIFFRETSVLSSSLPALTGLFFLSTLVLIIKDLNVESKCEDGEGTGEM